MTRTLIIIPLQKDPVPDDYHKRTPEHKAIYRFIRVLFNAAQLTAECAIVTLVTYLLPPLNPSNRCFIAGLL